jgi:hypothetical protein
MSPETQAQMARTAADLAATTGQAYSTVFGALMVAADVEAEAERRGAEKGWDEAAAETGSAFGRMDLQGRNPYRSATKETTA